MDVKEVKKVLLALVIGAAITTPIGLFFMGYLSTIESGCNPNLLGISGLTSALFMAINLLFVSFQVLIILTILATIMNLKKSNLKHEIVMETNRKFNLKLLDPSKVEMTTFYYADDEKLVMKRKAPYGTHILAGIVFVIALIPFLLDVRNNDVGLDDGAWLFYMFASIVNVLYNLRYSMRTVTFNRLKGTVTVPGFFMILSTRTIPFRKINVNAYDERLQIAIPFRLPNITIVGEGIQEWWSFYIWYMDKNRPLPTGTLFDAYREKDYLRRKAEGFPAPLYPSRIPTPEWSGAADKYGDTDTERRTRETHESYYEEFKRKYPKLYE